MVRDSRSRVGKVVGDTESVVINGETVRVVAVDFWGDEQRRPERLLTPLDGNSPEALLLERPAELASWADNAPLRLVALALSVEGGSGKVADIREKLDERVPGIKWDGWWRKAPSLMRKLPEHFSITKVGKDSEYKLLSSVDAIPASTALKSARDTDTGDSDRKSATSADWRNWLQAATHTPAPGRYPPKAALDALAAWPAPSAEQALLRVIVSAEEALSSRTINAQAAEGWLRAVAQASTRWREVGGNDPRGYTAARVGEVIARLARAAGDRAPLDLVLHAGAIDGVTDAWRRGFLAGMWESFDGDDARDMYLNSSAVLGRQGRGDLAREMFLTAFGPDFSDRRHPELDRFLDVLSESQRLQLLKEVIASATADQKMEMLAYMASSRHTEGVNRGGLRLLASLTLGDGTSEFEASVSREFASALEPKNHSVDAGPVNWTFAASTPTVTVHRSQSSPEPHLPVIQSIFSDTQARINEIISGKDAEQDELQTSLEAELQQERQEQERLRQQVRERNAELAANREESRLEIRGDMLLAVGEVLQSIHREQGSASTAGSVAAGLILALRAGGAEPLEDPRDLVDFDPELHQPEGSVPPHASVRVIAPGVIYRGGIHGDRVLLKAQVKHEAG